MKPNCLTGLDTFRSHVDELVLDAAGHLDVGQLRPTGQPVHDAVPLDAPELNLLRDGECCRRVRVSP